MNPGSKTFSVSKPSKRVQANSRMSALQNTDPLQVLVESDEEHRLTKALAEMDPELRQARLHIAFGPIVAVQRDTLQQLLLTTTNSTKKSRSWDPRSDPAFNKGMDKFKAALADNLCKALHETAAQCKSISDEADHDLNSKEMDSKIIKTESSKAASSPVMLNYSGNQGLLSVLLRVSPRGSTQWLSAFQQRSIMS